MRKSVSWTSVVLGIGAGVGVVRGGEQPVQRADVPPAVIAAVTSQYSGANLASFERDVEGPKTTFEVKVEVPAQGGKPARKLEVALTPAGHIVTEEEATTKDALPEPVKHGLGASKYASWQVVKAERVVTELNESAPAFELYVRDHDKQSEVIFDKSGHLTKEEEVHASAGHEGAEHGAPPAHGAAHGAHH